MSDLKKYYNEEKARAAQMRYCQEHEVPHFAPMDGYCHFCNRNIYVPVFDVSTGKAMGYSVEEAATSLITCCPYCHHTYVD